ncbi:hypothetical protein V6N13_091314 [Hibiscus sabdariffa]
MERVTKLASEKPVVIFSKSSCCMSHTIKTLFYEFGVDPAVHELDEIPRGCEIEQALLRLGCNPSVPAVFIGGEFVGGANEFEESGGDRGKRDELLTMIWPNVFFPVLIVVKSSMIIGLNLRIVEEYERWPVRPST